MTAHGGVHVERPTVGERPLVVSVPHAGRWIPDELRAAYRVDTHALQSDGDLYVDELYAGVVARGITVVRTTVSRFVVDQNRFRDDLSPAAVEGESVRELPGYYGDRGVIWAYNTRGRAIYRRPLGAAQAAERVARYWQPYHDALRGEVDRLVARFGSCVLLDAHSMPSRAARLHTDRGARRADIVPGDVYGQSCAPWVMGFTTAWWEALGYRVAPNSPYSGGAISRTYGSPRAGVHAIQLELNRALYMDERSLGRNAGFERLRVRCEDYAVALSDAMSERLLAG
jgi:N-formylglutamate amidohydrolase